MMQPLLLSAMSGFGLMKPPLGTERSLLAIAGADDEFAIRLRVQGIVVPSDGFHIAFRATSPEAVTAFYRAVLDLGGRDNGGAGFHPEYGLDYFAAFVFDPDGYHIEAVLDKNA
jgi:catechol 2,3-dioxygenase-like lactoylglutathione lyase family enzyme